MLEMWRIWTHKAWMQSQAGPRKSSIYTRTKTPASAEPSLSISTVSFKLSKAYTSGRAVGLKEHTSPVQRMPMVGKTNEVAVRVADYATTALLDTGSTVSTSPHH